MFLRVHMTSVMCFHVSMQEEDIVEQIDGMYHLRIL